MKDLKDLILSSLANKRITDILVYEKVAKPVREFFGIEHDEIGYPLETTDTGHNVKNFFGEALFCPYCTSVWTALFLSLLYVTNKKFYSFVIKSFSIAYVTVKLYEFDK